MSQAKLDARETQEVVERLSDEASLFRALSIGVSLERAVVDVARSFISAKRRVDIRSVVYSLSSGRIAGPAGQLGLGVVAHAAGYYDLVVDLFPDADKKASALKYITFEYIDSLLRLDTREGVKVAWALNRKQFEDVPLEQWYRIGCALVGRREFKLAYDILEKVSARSADANLEDAMLHRLAWTLGHLRRIVKRRPGKTPQAVNGIAYGIIDYKNIDYDATSSNIGDYVQTLAATSHLLRLSNVEITGEQPLADYLNEIKQRVKTEHKIDDVRGKVHVVTLQRDFSTGDDLPSPTWAPVFGWYMHGMFKGEMDFPFHENLRPIFVSFHVNRREMLTPAAVSYLKRYGPIGCRDWTTVYILRERGVDAFFSGCITTSVDTLFGNVDKDAVKRDGVALVDMTKARAAEYPDAKKIRHVYNDVRERDSVSNMKVALETLDHYLPYEKIITSRLHCYLPCSSIGLDVEFEPRRLSDVRFEGLLGLYGDKLDVIRWGIREKLEAVHRAIFSGASEEEVYATWRRVCEPDLKKAAAYCADVPALPKPSIDVDDVVDAVLSTCRECEPSGGKGTTVDIALASDENLKLEMPVVVESILANTERPVRFHVLTRGFSERDKEALEKLYPRAGFRWLDCDNIDYGPIQRLLVHTTVSTMDRLLLPLLMPGIDRVSYIDIDTIVLGDVGELQDLDLQGKGLAGRSSKTPSWAQGYNMIYRPADLLPYEVATELRRRMHQRFDLTFPAFNAGVSVLNLKKMREDNFVEKFLPFVERYGMNDQEVLNCYAGPDRAELDWSWNAIPSQDLVRQAKLVHWAGPTKPWGDMFALHQEEWEVYRNQFRDRLAAAGVSFGVESD